MLLYGFLAGVLSSIPTGPIGIMIVSNTLRRRMIGGVVTLLSLLAGELVYLFVFLRGLDRFIIGVSWVETPLFLGGGALMTYMGWSAFRGCKSLQSGASSESAHQSLWRMFGSGLVLTVTNPAILLIFASVLSMAASTFSSSRVEQHKFLLLCTMEIGVGAWFLTLIFLVGRIKGRMLEQIHRHLNVVSGLVLIGFGLFMIGKTLRTLF